MNVSVPKKISGVISHGSKFSNSKDLYPPSRPPIYPKRVIRWVQKFKASKPAPSQEETAKDLNKAPFQG